MNQDEFLALFRKLVTLWAESIEDLPPLAAQRDIAEKMERLSAELIKECGTDFTILFAQDIERHIWKLYDQKCRRSIAV